MLQQAARSDGFTGTTPNDDWGHGKLDVLAIVNEAPVCDVNGPYAEECQGATTTVSLDGTGSSDPNPGDALTYSWSTDCGGGGFDDPTGATPALDLDPGCFECTVVLTVTDRAGQSDTCSAAVTLGDTLAPSITCPADTTIQCDEPPDPSNTGQATSTDQCDASPAGAFSDAVAPGTCPEESTITRTWTASDACGNSSSCSQLIEVVDTMPPVIECNAPDSITPPDAPISFTVTATDNCDSVPSVELTGFDCFKFTKKGKRVDKRESCEVDLAGDTITIRDSGGVADHIVWTAQAVDGCGNVAEKQCELEVVKPDRGSANQN
jgi:hypothetical protein